MTKNDIARRTILKSAGHASVVAAGGFALSACGEGETALVCADPNKLSVSENSLRKANNYSEKSPHADKNCAGCSFMPPLTEGQTCGNCEIFIGPVNPAGYCDSFSARQA